MSEERSVFKLINVTKLKDLEERIVKEIPESDLCIQTGDSICQFEYVDIEDAQEKTIIKPGVFMFVETAAGLKLKKMELRTHDLLETATNTALIKQEANLFFKKVDVYKKFNKDPKRAILLYSGPGMGKTSSITKLAQDFIEEDPGTVVVFWDTSDIRSSSISKFLSVGSKFSKKTTRMLFVMEDIGGGNVEEYGGPRSADASLLELLDGASVNFSIPTFIIATTNTPQNLLKSLADRPGRFDQMFELNPPNAKERVQLAEHISKRKLTEDESEALSSRDANGLSIAHITEIIIRAELHDKSFKEVIKEMKDHKARVEKAFSNAVKGMGL
jgi:SpoVK/Ycf46/Vps4 family AAA+-type ATPase